MLVTVPVNFTGFCASYWIGETFDRWDGQSWTGTLPPPERVGGGSPFFLHTPSGDNPDGASDLQTFYLATSVVYDSFRAVGNLLLIAVLGPAVLPALERFRRRFLTVWVIEQASGEEAPGKISVDVGTPA